MEPFGTHAGANLEDVAAHIRKLAHAGTLMDQACCVCLNFVRDENIKGPPTHRRRHTTKASDAR